jgi:hypothetical protein
MNNKSKDTKTIIVKIKNVFGEDLIYPICKDAKTFTLLTGKKTLNMSDVGNIKALGYKVVVDSPATL